MLGARTKAWEEVPSDWRPPDLSRPISPGQAGKQGLCSSHCWLIKVQSESEGGTQPASFDAAQEAKSKENELCSCIRCTKTSLLSKPGRERGRGRPREEEGNLFEAAP